MTMPASDPLLEVSNLSITFGSHTAVDAISFKILPGQTLGLVGESGSGKSATSLAILRLLDPNARVTGSIAFDEAMHQVALPDPERRLRDYPHQFSGGQRQRILIAMAIVNRPRLLIADEPTTALDVTVQAQILALLRDLRTSHNLAMLFISHDLAVVSQIADHVAVMQHGQIVEQASARELFLNPQHPYTRRLLTSAPTMRTDRSKPLASLQAR
jgi:ABC-type dipeptide/oligopeptide/nickel transport system ATPase component